jgi:hypothetical protein
MYGIKALTCMGCRAALKRMFEKARMRQPYAGKSDGDIGAPLVAREQVLRRSAAGFVRDVKGSQFGPARA